jgi:hypothetical protein
LAVKDDMESDDPVFNEVTSFDIFSAHESSPPPPKKQNPQDFDYAKQEPEKMSPQIHT